mmetsp:Transcript_39417/g.117239  ORF Transcript_39417/g.117239 Transcript_39417/m.117239 type:complete len:251 (-) Transcript_39417:43-795(-)
MAIRCTWLHVLSLRSHSYKLKSTKIKVKRVKGMVDMSVTTRAHAHQQLYNQHQRTESRPSCGEAFAAAACAFCQGVGKRELRPELITVEVNTCAQQVHDCCGVDQNAHALLLHHLVKLCPLVCVVDRVAEAAAASPLYAKLQKVLMPRLQQRLDAFRGSVRQLYDRLPVARRRCGLGHRLGHCQQAAAHGYGSGAWPRPRTPWDASGLGAGPWARARPGRRNAAHRRRPALRAASRQLKVLSAGRSFGRA